MRKFFLQIKCERLLKKLNNYNFNNAKSKGCITVFIRSFPLDKKVTYTSTKKHNANK